MGKCPSRADALWKEIQSFLPILVAADERGY